MRPNLRLTIGSAMLRAAGAARATIWTTSSQKR